MRDYRSLEGRLYALGQPPPASPIQAHPNRIRGTHVFLGAQGTPPREVIPRLDLTLAVRRLPSEDADVIRDHYISVPRRPRRGAERKRAVTHLLSLLQDESSHS